MKIRQIARKYSWTLLVSILLMTTVVLGTSISSFGSDRTLSGRNSRIIELEKREMERVYRQDLRELLNGAGFSNSGINMTRIVQLHEQVDGSNDGTFITSYTVSIHHRRFSELSMDEINDLLGDIAGIDLPIVGSTVTYKFL